MAGIDTVTVSRRIHDDHEGHDEHEENMVFLFFVSFVVFYVADRSQAPSNMGQ